jgi:hypothetical protein
LLASLGSQYAAHASTSLRRIAPPIGLFGLVTDDMRSRWTCNFYGKPGGGGSGSGDDLNDCKRQFKATWATLRAGLTDAGSEGADVRAQRRHQRAVTARDKGRVVLGHQIQDRVTQGSLSEVTAGLLMAVLPITDIHQGRRDNR